MTSPSPSGTSVTASAAPGTALSSLKENLIRASPKARAASSSQSERMSVAASADDSHTADGDRQRHSASLSLTSPPELRVILDFMVRCSAKSHGSSGTASGVPPPYTFTGCDYALVLHACFPGKCIDLTSLCWSSVPLPSQLTGNLERFCLAARELGLAEAPFSALHPHLLQPVAANALHHIKVQHWLFITASRFPPNPAYDALAMRVFLRHQQLAAPLLKRTRTEFEAGGVVVAVENTKDSLCPSLNQLPPFSVTQLSACKAYLAPVPPFTTPTSAEAEANTSSEEGGNAKAPGRGASPPPASGGDKPKPWLSYSKPWRIPALDAAKAKKEAEAAAAAKRLAARQSRDPSRCAFADSSSSALNQYEVSRDAARQLQDQLREVHATLMASLMRTGTPDFATTLDALNKAGIVPPTPRSTE